jgi:SlyX protein
MQERLTDIEIKLAHLENTVNELSEALYVQQGSMQKLERLCELLQQRIQSMDTPGGENPQDERPPHY